VLEECLRKEHPLQEIFRSGYEDEEQNVVRWCPQCGAVVVDAEYDGRTAPGRIRSMAIPAISREILLPKR